MIRCIVAFIRAWWTKCPEPPEPPAPAPNPIPVLQGHIALLQTEVATLRMLIANHKHLLTTLTQTVIDTTTICVNGSRYDELIRQLRALE